MGLHYDISLIHKHELHYYDQLRLLLTSHQEALKIGFLRMPLNCIIIKKKTLSKIKYHSNFQGKRKRIFWVQQKNMMHMIAFTSFIKELQI